MAIEVLTGTCSLTVATWYNKLFPFKFNFKVVYSYFRQFRESWWRGTCKELSLAQVNLHLRETTWREGSWSHALYEAEKLRKIIYKYKLYDPIFIVNDTSRYTDEKTHNRYPDFEKNVKYKRSDALSLWHHGGHSRTPTNQRWDQVPGRSQRFLIKIIVRYIYIQQDFSGIKQILMKKKLLSCI